MKILTLILCIVCYSNCVCENYFIAKNGDDNNLGTINSPWRTLTRGVSSITAGDTLFIREGVYNEQIILLNSGTDIDWISIMNYRGEIVTIDGTGISVSEYDEGIFQSNSEYVKLEGINFINASSHGILLDEAKNFIIEHCSTFNTFSSGIGVWNSENISIRQNKIELACNGGEFSLNECLTIGNTINFEVFGNEVFNGNEIRGEGIDLKDGSKNGRVYKNEVYSVSSVGIYLDAWNKDTGDIDVFQNNIHNIRGSGICLASEAGGLLHNIRIYNNIIHNNDNVGITLANWGEDTTHFRPIMDIEIINNTIHNNGNGDWGGGISLENPDTKNLVVRNNICSRNLMFQIVSDFDLDNKVLVDHNLIYEFKDFYGELLGESPIQNSPQFSDAHSFDFSLSGFSPAIDNGSDSLAPAIDFDGNIRPIGSGVDIGAYEYNSVSRIIVDEIPTNFMLYQNYPNPFNPETLIEYNIPDNAGNALQPSLTNVQLTVYDILGNDIKKLVDKQQTPGNYRIEFHSGNLASGVYIYQLKTDKFLESKKMLLLR